MKTILQFGSDSPYLPICLPPMCDNTCRTRSGQTQEQILGKTAVSINAGYRSIYNLKIISKGKCQELVEDFVLQSGRTMRKIRRWQCLYLSKIHFAYILLHDRDHLCTDKPEIPRDVCGKVENEDTGGPLSIEERDGR